MSMARLTLRLDFGPGQAIGHGKIRLLEAVRDYGSISAAGRSMEMSYRRAWLLIDGLNELFEGPVIETNKGRLLGVAKGAPPPILGSTSGMASSFPPRSPTRLSTISAFASAMTRS